MRAVTVPVDDVRGVAGFIFPGDFVDVVLTRTNNSNGPPDLAEVILQHVKVLAIDQTAGEHQERPKVAKSVTVEASRAGVEGLLATNVGKLSLILRQPSEVAVAPDARVTARDLFGGEASTSLPLESPSPPPTVSQVSYVLPQPPPAVRAPHLLRPNPRPEGSRS